MTTTHRPPTLEDVARAAGVSRATASRVIAGTGYAATRERVTVAADLLGYAPNPAARALVRGTGVRLVVAVTGTAPLPRRSWSSGGRHRASRLSRAPHLRDRRRLGGAGRVTSMDGSSRGRLGKVTPAGR